MGDGTKADPCVAPTRSVARSRRDRRLRRSRVRRVILLVVLLAALVAALLTPDSAIDARASADNVVRQVPGPGEETGRTGATARSIIRFISGRCRQRLASSWMLR